MVFNSSYDRVQLKIEHNIGEIEVIRSDLLDFPLP